MNAHDERVAARVRRTLAERADDVADLAPPRLPAEVRATLVRSVGTDDLVGRRDRRAAAAGAGGAGGPRARRQPRTVSWRVAVATIAATAAVIAAVAAVVSHSGDGPLSRQLQAIGAPARQDGGDALGRPAVTDGTPATVPVPTTLYAPGGAGTGPNSIAGSVLVGTDSGDGSGAGDAGAGQAAAGGAGTNGDDGAAAAPGILPRVAGSVPGGEGSADGSTTTTLAVAGGTGAPAGSAGSGAGPAGAAAVGTSAAPAAPGPAGGPVPSGFAARAVSFVSPSVGWAVGSADCPAGVAGSGVGPCQALLRTRDGGKTWVSLPPTGTRPSGGSGPVPAGVRFADGQNGWLFGGGSGLQATHDGGASWAEVDLGGSAGVSDVEVGDGAAFALAGGSPQLFRAPIGGDGWSPVSGVSGSQLVTAGAAVWVLGETSEGLRWFASADGSSWGDARRDLPCQGSGARLAAGSASDLTLVCAGDSRAVFASHDGGAHFESVGEVPATPAGPPAALAQSGSSAVVAAMGSALVGSFDGGRTWSTVLDGSAPLADVRLAGDGGVATTSDGRLWLSDDGGHHWVGPTSI